MKLKRLFLVLCVGIGLFALWHESLLVSLVQPTLISRGIISHSVSDQIQDNQLQYESLGISVPLTIDAQTSPLVQSDWSAIRTALLHGASLSYQGDSLDETKLAFITGHSSDTTRHPYDSVFAPLGQAKVNDTFIVNVDHVQHLYRVVSTQQINPGNGDAFAALSPTDLSHRVVLVTCWPPLTTRMRMVVVGQRLD